MPTDTIRRAATAAAALTITSAALAQTGICPDLGVPVGDRPTWRERAVLVLTNAARMAPTQYRDAYLGRTLTILNPVNHPPVPPLSWNDGLARAARAQSVDLATTPNCPFSHNSCNGTSFASRVESYYPGYSTIAENIAGGQTDPLAAVNAWLYDAVAGGPAVDLTPQAGHRTNIMSSAYTELGVGYAAGGPYRHYWTEDFGRPQAARPSCGPVYAGAHIVRTGNVEFWANYYAADNRAPRSASLVLGGVRHALGAYLGPEARGTYRLVLPAAGACRSYHFEFTDAAGAVWRYPARGELRTGGDGCAESYTATSTTPPPPPPACAADFDGSGQPEVADVFAYLRAWFAGEAAAGTSGAGGEPAISDLFAFLRVWFAGC